jgi:hypothetical protein
MIEIKHKTPATAYAIASQNPARSNQRTLPINLKI